MSPFPTWSEFSASVLDPSFGLALFVKWTAVLALAWLSHAMLARRNPRWRVALWRSAIVGLAAVSVLSLAPPLVTYQTGPRDQPPMGVAPTVSIAPAFEIDQAPGIIREGEPTVPVRPVPSVASSGSAIRRDVPAPPSAPAEIQRFSWGDRLVSGLRWAWLSGVVVLTARLVVGSLALARIIRRSSEVPDGIAGACRTIAERLGCRRTVRVRRTSDVTTPCLAGPWRPVLLLPDRECEEARPDDLRAILAHELAHARNHDLGWNLAAHLATILLWFHPMAWRIRGACVGVR